METLKTQMLRDMEIRGFARSTLHNYMRAASAYFRWLDISPHEATTDDIIRYQEYLIRVRKYSWSNFNIHVCAIRFLYNQTLRRETIIRYIPFQKRPKKLPVVLSREEIASLYLSIDKLRDKAIFLLLYSCGMRVSEVASLKISHIDSKRMLIYIEEGKGRKDRYGVMSKKLLHLLRRYYRACHNRISEYLFPGLKPGAFYSTRNIQKIIRGLSGKTGLQKQVTPHVLRHSYATHMLEDGYDVRKIQMLLGHSSLRTTAIYLHVVDGVMSKIESPIDKMDLE
jgi:integrase/recombinase XerD